MNRKEMEARTADLAFVGYGSHAHTLRQAWEKAQGKDVSEADTLALIACEMRSRELLTPTKGLMPRVMGVLSRERPMSEPLIRGRLETPYPDFRRLRVCLLKLLQHGQVHEVGEGFWKAGRK